MNFRETLSFCARNVMYSWIGSVGSMAKITLDIIPTTSILLSIGIFLPRVYSAISPEEGLKLLKIKQTEYEQGQNIPDPLRNIDDGLIRMSYTQDNCLKNYHKNICTLAIEVVRFFKIVGADVEYDEIKHDRDLIIFSDSEPYLRKANLNFLTKYCNNIINVCKINTTNLTPLCDSIKDFKHAIYDAGLGPVTALNNSIRLYVLKDTLQIVDRSVFLNFLDSADDMCLVGTDHCDFGW